MSSSDVSDMLKGIPSQSSSSSSTAAARIPPMSATYVSRKSDFRSNTAAAAPGRVTKYARLPFTNSARKDGLVLHHWRRAKTAKGADYEFAKFNHTTRLVVYTDVEYTTLRKIMDANKDGQTAAADKAWSKEETDYLLSLCFHFGLRWPVIADRYDYAASGLGSSSKKKKTNTTNQNRDIASLKNRYYKVARTVLNHRYNRDIKSGSAPARVDLSAPYNVSVLQPGPVEAKLLMAFQWSQIS